MSWQVRLIAVISTQHRTEISRHFQIHYNLGADLFTYLKDASVFAVKNGYIEALEGMGIDFSDNFRF